MCYSFQFTRVLNVTSQTVCAGVSLTFSAVGQLVLTGAQNLLLDMNFTVRKTFHEIVKPGGLTAGLASITPLHVLEK